MKNISTEIVLCSNVPFQSDCTGNDGKNESKCKTVAVLKSQLQKVIRRSNTYRTALTSARYLELDTIGFLRRLTVIAVEDALPLQGYEVITFLLAAVSKGAILTPAMNAYCLAYAVALAQCNHYEEFYSPQPPLPVSRGKFMKLADKERDLPYSLLLRESYGGMKGDVSLCRSAAILWSLRYNTKSVLCSSVAAATKFLNYNEQANAFDWYLPAIDFHCCPDMISLIKEKHDNYTTDEIKMAIWKCNSCITDKKLLTDNYSQRLATERDKAIWKDIKRDVVSYQMYKTEKLTAI